MGKLWVHKQWLLVIIPLLALVIWVSASFLAKESQPKEVFDGLPLSYSYLEKESPGKIRLHMMSVSPENIILRAAGSPLRQVAAYGINGGFFYGKDLLSIAIMNDIPVSGDKKAYGSGWFNAKYPRGTLVWDGETRKLSVQVASSGDDLEVSDRTQYWAQGGISMNLQDQGLWQSSAMQEHLPYADELRMRSGLVYDNTSKLWLIVTPSRCTAGEFRTAILESVPGEDPEGIFLDGDGSSQMNASEAVLVGDKRMVVQMIAVGGD
ncbi:hypothetical protein PWYN_17155 [Paenibacillus wynnii]|uniref:Phosphodiester glycosidase domain-containing protein n=1 Tax=Paenibacillus wynnii TaxID=268407 RepID=A0A098M392_9BACL|nr:hypothetical protein PWYN_17155 [Paenibacillus wynnii]